VRLQTTAAVLLAAAVLVPDTALAEKKSVALPEIANGTVAPRVVYLENPRFPPFTTEGLRQVLSAAAGLVKDHFGIKVVLPKQIDVRPIDKVFAELARRAPRWLKRKVGDFRNDRVDWNAVRKNLIKQIEKQKDPLEKQIAFARPYLSTPVQRAEVASFARAVAATFRDRLAHWTTATLADGHPIIGRVPGRPDLPLNEYMYWILLTRNGFPAEIILTNQLVASVEYIPTPVHTSIRGGISGGATEYNPDSKLGSSVWVSLFPYVSDDPQIVALRRGDRYSRAQALAYAGAMLAHEMGHQLLHVGHPWSNPACVMRPAEVLDFAAWVKKFDAAGCRLGSSAAMKPGAIRIPVW